MIGKVCMVRTYSAGVFLGKLEERNGKEVRLPLVVGVCPVTSLLTAW